MMPGFHTTFAAAAVHNPNDLPTVTAVTRLTAFPAGMRHE
jgi:hypothetical protein